MYKFVYLLIYLIINLLTYFTYNTYFTLLTYLITYLLTYSMVQCHSWGTKLFAASQEIPRISRNPKVHYRTHKRPPPVSILGRPNPVHIPTSNLLDIHPNVIQPPTLSSPMKITRLLKDVTNLRRCRMRIVGRSSMQLNSQRSGVAKFFEPGANNRKGLPWERWRNLK